MARIAISYRRDDSASITGRIYDRLVARYGDDSVFMDIDAIPLAVDYTVYIGDVLRATDLLIVVIGPRWTGPLAAGGNRIDDPKDPVRVEVAEALHNNTRILPLLVEGAVMPEESTLPEDLHQLALLNALDVDAGKDFSAHIDRLIAFIDSSFPQLARASPPPARRSRAIPQQYRRPLIVGSVVLAALVMVYLILPFVLIDNLTSSLAGAGWLHDWVATLPGSESAALRLIAAQKLRDEYNRVVHEGQLHNEPVLTETDFEYARHLVDFLRSFGEENGFVLYFDGQINEAIAKARPAEVNIQDNVYSSWFRYLENIGPPTPQAVRDEIAHGDRGDSEYCYQHVDGYCQQRTAWIRFVLANVFYCAAVERTPPLVDETRRGYIARAAQYLSDSYKNYPQGFIQLIPSATLGPALRKAAAESPLAADLPGCPL